MKPSTARRLVVATVSFLCGCHGDALAPDRITPNTRAAEADGRYTVVVNPNASGHGVARTIQEGVDMVAGGGTVLVMPGTYVERVTIDRGLTLAAMATEAGQVVIEQVLAAPAPSGRDAVVSVTTTEPVVIRDVVVRHEHLRGLNVLFTASDLTVERVSFEGRYPSAPPIINNGVSVVTNASQWGGRARIVVRESRFAVEGNAISLGGDVDAVIERNTFAHGTTNAGCVFVSPIGQGVTVPAGAQTNVSIVGNTFDDCGSNAPGKGVTAISILGTLGAATTGTVDIVGNVFHTTARAPAACNGAGIVYEFYGGRIERNTLVGTVQDCAAPSPRSLPAAVFVGSRVAGMRAATVMVRFNDIAGNAHAGLWLGANQSVPIDATCNWWGDATGPSGAGAGSGNRIVIEAGAATPTFVPFATTPIAAAPTSCGGGV